MLKAGKEDLEATLAQVDQLLQAKKAVLDKELERQAQAALVDVSSSNPARRDSKGTDERDS